MQKSRLNKEICKLCYYNYGWIWYNKDNDRWIQGILNCPHNMILVKIKESLPEKCSYILEQLLESNNYVK